MRSFFLSAAIRIIMIYFILLGVASSYKLEGDRLLLACMARNVNCEVSWDPACCQEQDASSEGRGFTNNLPTWSFGNSILRNAIPPPRPYKPPTYEEIFGDKSAEVTDETDKNDVDPAKSPSKIGINLNMYKNLKGMKKENQEMLMKQLSGSKLATTEKTNLFNRENLLKLKQLQSLMGKMNLRPGNTASAPESSSSPAGSLSSVDLKGFNRKYINEKLEEYLLGGDATTEPTTAAPPQRDLSSSTTTTTTTAVDLPATTETSLGFGTGFLADFRQKLRNDGQNAGKLSEREQQKLKQMLFSHARNKRKRVKGLKQRHNMPPRREEEATDDKQFELESTSDVTQVEINHKDQYNEDGREEGLGLSKDVPIRFGQPAIVSSEPGVLENPYLTSVAYGRTKFRPRLELAADSAQEEGEEDDLKAADPPHHNRRKIFRIKDNEMKFLDMSHNTRTDGTTPNILKQSVQYPFQTRQGLASPTTTTPPPTTSTTTTVSTTTTTTQAPPTTSGPDNAWNEEFTPELCERLRVPCRFVTEHACCELEQTIQMVGRPRALDESADLRWRYVASSGHHSRNPPQELERRSGEGRAISGFEAQGHLRQPLTSFSVLTNQQIANNRIPYNYAHSKEVVSVPRYYYDGGPQTMTTILGTCWRLHYLDCRRETDHPCCSLAAEKQIMDRQQRVYPSLLDKWLIRH